MSNSDYWSNDLNNDLNIDPDDVDDNIFPHSMAPFNEETNSSDDSWHYYEKDYFIDRLLREASNNSGNFDDD